ncbi:MAG: glycosyltransferase [Bacteroidia bacterium]
MITKQHSILVTVVTRNRPKNLDTFLNLISNQTLQPDKVLVIDNDSEPETKFVVEKHLVQNNKIKYLNTQTNGGSAGGQCVALNYAAANNFDLVYTLDDDCEPTPTAIEKVYEKWLAQPDKDNVVLSGISLSLDDDTFSFALWTIEKNIFAKNNTCYWSKNEIPDNKITDGIFWGWSHFFLGVLIPTKIIKRIGSVNRKYFIRGDELEYFVRLKESGVKLGAVIDSVVKHPKETSQNNNKAAEVKKYFTIRNNTDIRLTYYPDKKYNYTFYKLWLKFYPLFFNKHKAEYLATKDAIEGNFNSSFDDIANLLKN